MKRLYLTYDEGSHGGGYDESDDSDGPYRNRNPEYKQVTFKKFYREPPADRFFYDSVEVEDDLFNEKTLCLAVVRYSTGDTFGTSHGHWHIEGVYKTEEEAEAALKEAVKPSPPPKKGEMQRYKVWEGYFERLEDTEVLS